MHKFIIFIVILVCSNAVKRESCSNCNGYDDCLSSCFCFGESSAVTFQDAINICDLFFDHSGLDYCAIGYSYWAGYKYRCCVNKIMDDGCNGDASPNILSPDVVADADILLKLNNLSQEMNYVLFGVLVIIFAGLIMCLYKCGTHLICNKYKNDGYKFEINYDKIGVITDEDEPLK